MNFTDTRNSSISGGENCGALLTTPAPYQRTCPSSGYSMDARTMSAVSENPNTITAAFPEPTEPDASPTWEASSRATEPGSSEPGSYRTPSAAVPPDAPFQAPASPSPHVSPRHAATARSMPWCSSSAASATPSLESSGVMRYRLSPDMASSGAVEQHDTTISPLSSA